MCQVVYYLNIKILNKKLFFLGAKIRNSMNLLTNVDVLIFFFSDD